MLIDFSQKFLYIYIIMEKKIIILLLITLTNANLILNGNFESPQLPKGNSLGLADSWVGTNYQLENKNRMGLIQGQYVDLRVNNSQLGILSQLITIQQQSNLNLKFYFSIFDSTPNEYLLVLWNDSLIFRYQPISPEDGILNINFTARNGTYNITFAQCSNNNSNSHFGFYLDDIELTILNYTSNIDDFNVSSFSNTSTINSSSVQTNQTSSLVITNQTNAQLFQDTFSNQENKFEIEQDVLSIQERRVLNQFSSSTEAFMENTLNIYTIVRTSFVSFFLLGTVNFWNLSLMYNMLLINSVPKFTREFLVKLTKLFYRSNSGTNMLAQKFPQSEHIFIPQKYQKELMLKIKQQVIWFGLFDISSLFFKNNIQIIFLFLFLFIKIGLPLLILHTNFCPPFIKNKIPDTLQLYHIFLMQLIGFQVFMVMSAVCNILNIGFSKPSQKIDSFFHAMTIWGSIIVYPLCFFVAIRIKEKKMLKTVIQQRKKKNQKAVKTEAEPLIIQNVKKLQFVDIPTQSLAMENRIRKNIRKIYSTQLYTILEYIFLPIIPFLVQMNAPFAFLLVISFILIFRAYWFCKYARTMLIELNQKIFSFINIVFWFLLQIVYIGFYIASSVTDNSDSDSNRKSDTFNAFCKIFGFFSAIVISFGGVFQVLRNFTQTFKFIISKIVQLIKQKCQQMNRKQNKIFDFQQQIQIENNKKSNIRESNSLKIQTNKQQTFEIQQQDYHNLEMKKRCSENSKKTMNVHTRNNSEIALIKADRKIRKQERDKKKQQQDIKNSLYHRTNPDFIAAIN